MSSSYITDPTRTLDLGHEQLLVLDDRPGTRIQVLAGGLWLTEEGHLEDRFAGAGEWLRLEARGRTVAEALGPTRVVLVDPAQRPSARRHGTLARWWPRADQLAARSLAITLSLLLGLGLPEMLARGLQGMPAAADAVAVAAQTDELH